MTRWSLGDIFFYYFGYRFSCFDTGNEDLNVAAGQLCSVSAARTYSSTEMAKTAGWD